MALVRAANQNCRTIVSAELNSHHDIREMSVTLRTKVCDSILFHVIGEMERIFLFHSSS